MTVHMSKEFKKNKDYFKPGSDLDDKKTNNYFKEADNLNDTGVNNYFKKASDLDEQVDLDKSDNTHDDEIIATGCMLVTPEQLKKMIEEGYKILEVVDCGPLFSVTFESKNFNKGKGR